jgi:hypothetical protein
MRVAVLCSARENMASAVSISASVTISGGMNLQIQERETGREFDARAVSGREQSARSRAQNRDVRNTHVRRARSSTAKRTRKL